MLVVRGLEIRWQTWMAGAENRTGGVEGVICIHFFFRGRIPIPVGISECHVRLAHLSGRSVSLRLMVKGITG